MKIVLVAGTRPEVIKLAPVWRALRGRGVRAELWLTGQHGRLARGPAEFFGLPVARSWSAPKPGQGSNELLARLLERLDGALARARPAAVVVQGDTTSALAGALAAFHRGIPVAHVEAGLRSGDLAAPFPEEMNRRAIDAFARWLFPPTAGARRALLAEGHRDVPAPTGNTGIDALLWARARVRDEDHWPRGMPRLREGVRLVLSTGHRRESLGSALEGALHAAGREVERAGDAVLIHAAHPNPSATRDARRALARFERSYVVPALAYPDFVALLDRACAVVTDSGGIQEEAPSFGIPVVITREVTERPEVLRHGGVLAGTDPARVARAVRAALGARPRRGASPFGDGRAAERIAARLRADLRRR
jgi:UDP-N-acetylglucosamine 2-epimerase (non-hydrolysing)